MIEKGANQSKSLFCHYKGINICESENSKPKDKSASNLIRILSKPQSNSQYCELFGLDIDRLHILAEGTDLRDGVAILLQYLKDFRINIPLVKAYNSIKHGMMVRMKDNCGKIYIEFILEMESIDKCTSKAKYTGLTITSKLLGTMVDNMEKFSVGFQALFGIIKTGYDC